MKSPSSPFPEGPIAGALTMGGETAGPNKKGSVPHRCVPLARPAAADGWAGTDGGGTTASLYLGKRSFDQVPREKLND